MLGILGSQYAICVGKIKLNSDNNDENMFLLIQL